MISKQEYNWTFLRTFHASSNHVCSKMTDITLEDFILLKCIFINIHCSANVPILQFKFRIQNSNLYFKCEDLSQNLKFKCFRLVGFS